MVLGLAFGTTYVFAVVGGHVIRPTNIDWLRADAVSHYLGWAFLREDPITALPLTWTDRIGYPLTSSTAYFDPVPALSILFLPLSRVLPEPFQYLGIFECISAGLLFYFGRELGRLFSGSRWFAIASGFLFLGNFVFTMRLGGHAALTAQFFLVWALCETLSPVDPSQAGSRSVRKIFARLAVLGLAALGVNPYLALMVLVVIAASVFTLFLRVPSDRRFVAGAAGTLTMAYGAAAWFFGYVGGSETLRGPGFDQYSANLNTFVNPILFSRFASGLSVARAEQLEGAAYLGASGLALLVAAAIAAARSPRYRAWLTRHLPLLVAAIAAFLFSLSNRVTLGGATLLDLPLGNTALRALSVFRTVGRFSWILFYVTYAVGVAAVAHLLPPKRGAVALAILAAVQLLELSPLRAGVRASAAESGARAAPLPDPTWRSLRARHEHLVVLPAWQCGPSASPGGADGYATFGLLAAREHMTINSYYSSRYDDRKFAFHCRTLPAQVLQKGPENDTAYVVGDSWAAWFRASVTTHECRVVDGYNLCVRR